MQNYYQFSAAKDLSESKAIQYLLYDENKVLRDYYKFHDLAINEVCEPYRDWWLRVEYDNASRSVVMGEQWRAIESDKDLYPYWQYRGVMDERERDEHVALEGLVFKIGDPDGDRVYPPNDWNCRCSAETLDDQDLQDQGLEACTNDESKEYLDKYVDDQFQFNPGVQGMLPKEGSYFDSIPNVNNADYKLFDLPPISDSYLSSNFEYFQTSGLHYLVETVNDWRNKYHTDNKGNVVFQNKKIFANIRFSDNALHTIIKNYKGFDQLPGTLENPDEVWGQFIDDRQLQVKRNYIKFGKYSYVVQTKNGMVENAFLVRGGNKYRKGLLIYEKK